MASFHTIECARYKAEKQPQTFVRTANIWSCHADMLYFLVPGFCHFVLWMLMSVRTQNHHCRLCSGYCTFPYSSFHSESEPNSLQWPKALHYLSSLTSSSINLSLHHSSHIGLFTPCFLNTRVLTSGLYTGASHWAEAPHPDTHLANSLISRLCLSPALSSYLKS